MKVSLQKGGEHRRQSNCVHYTLRFACSHPGVAVDGLTGWQSSHASAVISGFVPSEAPQYDEIASSWLPARTSGHMRGDALRGLLSGFTRAKGLSSAYLS